MDNAVNADMSEFWNGEGGQKWLHFQDRLKVNLMPFGNMAMDAASFSAGDRVLDVGCGCGDTTIEIARLVGPAGNAHGIDISTPILSQATQGIPAAAKLNVTFERADAQVHQFEAGTFDVVFSRFGVMFFDDPVVAFANLRSALKPGGRVAFTAWQSAKNNEWVSLPLGVVAKHMPLPEPLGPEEPGPFSFGDQERVERILTQAGFSDIQMEGVNCPFVVGDNLDFATGFLMQMGPASSAIAKSDADEETKERISGDMRDALKALESDRGVVMSSATWVVTAQNPPAAGRTESIPAL